jgi:CheY-like chemotaxis protein
MSVVLLTGDLACSAQASAAASRVGVQLQVVMDASRLAARCAEAAPQLVILDLNTAALDCQAALDQLRTLPHLPRTVAFGPHVHAARLEAARQAGCDEVLSRGEFYARLDELISPD